MQREILKNDEICKLPNDGAVVRFDYAFEISDKTAPVVEFDGYLVIANIFCVNHVKHSLDQWIDLIHQSLDVFFRIAP